MRGFVSQSIRVFCQALVVLMIQKHVLKFVTQNMIEITSNYFTIDMFFCGLVIPMVDP